MTCSRKDVHSCVLRGRRAPPHCYADSYKAAKNNLSPDATDRRHDTTVATETTTTTLCVYKIYAGQGSSDFLPYDHMLTHSPLADPYLQPTNF